MVDSRTFIQEFACRNPVATRPDLGGDQSLFRPVVDLLVEQIEVADYVLLNKVDLLGEERVPELEAIIRSINPLCQVVSCSHGQVRCTHRPSCIVPPGICCSGFHTCFTPTVHALPHGMRYRRTSTHCNCSTRIVSVPRYPTNTPPTPRNYISLLQ